MPTGLPDLSDIAESARSAIESAPSQFRAAADYLHIPSRSEYSDSVRRACVDAVRSARSLWHLLFLTFRPLLILLALLSRYLVSFLRILAECTVKHGIVAAREGAGQARVAGRWFVGWQRSLSRGAVLAELGCIAGLVGVYLLRRHIKRRRYVERVRRWGARKKARALRRYNNFVTKLSQTSTFLALLLPHALYVSLMALTKYFAPWLLRYFATKTYLTALISLWVPFVRTVVLLHRWQDTVQKKGKASESKDGGEVGAARAKLKGGGSSGVVGSAGKKKPSKVAERYLKATEQSYPSTAQHCSLARQRRGKLLGAMDGGGESAEVLYDDATELLKYWVVYALILAIFETASMLPIVSRIASVADPAEEAPIDAGVFARRAKAAPSVWESIKLSHGFALETKLVFFLWLRYLPTSLTSAAHSTTHGVKGKIVTWEGGRVPSNTPLDILYHMLAPAAVAAADSSSNLSQATDSDTGVKGALHQVMKFVKSFLQVAVFMKVISEPRKKWIETTLVECSALLPAFVTLLMPSYFTAYGCVYVSKVVPSANSATSLSAMSANLAADDHALEREDLAAGMRYLKYWVVHSLLSMLLSSFAPLLAWVPLSTHATWLLWAYVQLEFSTEMMYTVFEWELKAFGLLRRHDGDEEEVDVDKTMTFSILRKVSSALPSAAPDKAIKTESEKGMDVLESITDRVPAEENAADAMCECTTEDDGLKIVDNSSARDGDSLGDTVVEENTEADRRESETDETTADSNHEQSCHKRRFGMESSSELPADDAAQQLSSGHVASNGVSDQDKSKTE